MLLRLSTILFFSCLVFSSCKTSKNIDKGITSIDSVETMRVDTVIVKKTDSIGVVKYDSGSTQVAVINFNYDSVIRKPYVSKITVYQKKQADGTIVEKVQKIDSTSFNKKDSTQLIASANHYSKQVERKGISWWSWLILIPISIVGFIVMKYWSQIKLIFNAIPK